MKKTAFLSTFILVSGFLLLGSLKAVSITVEDSYIQEKSLRSTKTLRVRREIHIDFNEETKNLPQEESQGSPLSRHETRSVGKMGSTLTIIMPNDEKFYEQFEKFVIAEDLKKPTEESQKQVKLSVKSKKKTKVGKYKLECIKFKNIRKEEDLDFLREAVKLTKDSIFCKKVELETSFHMDAPNNFQEIAGSIIESAKSSKMFGISNIFK